VRWLRDCRRDLKRQAGRSPGQRAFSGCQLPIQVVPHFQELPYGLLTQARLLEASNRCRSRLCSFVCHDGIHWQKHPKQRVARRERFTRAKVVSRSALLPSKGLRGWKSILGTYALACYANWFANGLECLRNGPGKLKWGSTALRDEAKEFDVT